MEKSWLIRLRCVAAVLLMLAVVGCGGGGGGTSDVQTLPTLRTDLNFGYFSSVRDQPQRTQGYVNYYHQSFFEGTDKALADVQFMNRRTWLSFDTVFFDIGPDRRRVLRPTAAADLRALLARFQAASLLRLVTEASVVDEPDVQGVSDADVIAAVAILRGVFMEYGVGIRAFSTYGDRRTYPGIDVMDTVMFDQYYSGASILTDGTYASFKARTRPYQHIYLLPGAADPWREQPDSWISFAHADPQIKGIMVFAWFTNRAPDADYGKGVEENGTEGAWCRAGSKLIGVQTTCPP